MQDFVSSAATRKHLRVSPDASVERVVLEKRPYRFAFLFRNLYVFDPPNAPPLAAPPPLSPTGQIGVPPTGSAPTEKGELNEEQLASLYDDESAELGGASAAGGDADLPEDETGYGIPAVEGRIRVPESTFQGSYDRELAFLEEGMQVHLSFYKDKALMIHLPMIANARIADVQLSSNANLAVLENGVNLKVPPYVQKGDRVLVKTDDWTFHGRA